MKIPKGGNQHPYIEEEQTTQWPKEKLQKNKQRSTKHTYKTKDRVTRTPLKTGGEFRCSRRVSSSFSTSDTRRVNLVRVWYCDWKISGERTYFGKFMTSVTRKKTPSELTCMDDVQLDRVHVYWNHPHGLSECLQGYYY